MTNKEKIDISAKGFKWFRETLVLYGKSKLTGDKKLEEHIGTEVDLIETIVKAALNSNEEI